MSPYHYNDEFDSLFELLGNRTRYEILRLISQEPMFLGQLSRELEVGQQAILRHLRRLLAKGFLETYEDESIRGPPRKYYRLSKAVRLTVHITPDGLRVIRVVQSKKPPQTPEAILRNNYPELYNLISRAHRLPEIPNSLDRKRVAIEFIQQLEKKMSELKEIQQYLQSAISSLRKRYL